VHTKITRARAALGVGAIGTVIATATGAAVASGQEQAPEPTAAPATQARAAAAPASRSAIRFSHRRLNVRAGRTAIVAGVLTPRSAGKVVTLQRRGHRRWVTIARDRTSRTGGFDLRVRTRSASTAPVRVRFGGDRGAKPARKVAGRLNAFRAAYASWYGPGLYGNRLACGGTLNAGTVGVAHKYLPCGTKLVLRKGNRTVAARVIDRGPYVGGREFDLTAATKQRLGFGSTGTVWVAQ
jgi:hypothetical protein